MTDPLPDKTNKLPVHPMNNQVDLVSLRCFLFVCVCVGGGGGGGGGGVWE